MAASARRFNGLYTALRSAAHNASRDDATLRRLSAVSTPNFAFLPNPCDICDAPAGIARTPPPQLPVRARDALLRSIS